MFAARSLRICDVEIENGRENSGFVFEIYNHHCICLCYLVLLFSLSFTLKYIL